jgi:hypothetical protein
MLESADDEEAENKALRRPEIRLLGFDWQQHVADRAPAGSGHHLSVSKDSQAQVRRTWYVLSKRQIRQTDRLCH